MKKIIKISAIIVTIITFIALCIFGTLKEKSRINAEKIQRKNQITQVSNVQEETVFETTNQEEANQLISEIQNNNKKIIKIEVKKQNPGIKNTAIIIKITYKN